MSPYAKRKYNLHLAKKKLWKLCKEIVRKKYGNVCYTCDRGNLVGSNWHTGHMIPKSVCGAYLKYDIRNLRPQCYHCNINLGGNGAEFLRRMIEREGQSYVDNLYRQKNQIYPESIRVKELTEEYSKWTK